MNQISTKMKRKETNIDQLMLDHDIRTDKELADKLNISYSGLSQKINTGKITLKTLNELSEIFEVTVKDLIK